MGVGEAAECSLLQFCGQLLCGSEERRVRGNWKGYDESNWRKLNHLHDDNTQLRGVMESNLRRCGFYFGSHDD